MTHHCFNFKLNVLRILQKNLEMSQEKTKQVSQKCMSQQKTCKSAKNMRVRKKENKSEKKNKSGLFSQVRKKWCESETLKNGYPERVIRSHTSLKQRKWHFSITNVCPHIQTETSKMKHKKFCLHAIQWCFFNSGFDKCTLLSAMVDFPLSPFSQSGTLFLMMSSCGSFFASLCFHSTGGLSKSSKNSGCFDFFALDLFDCVMTKRIENCALQLQDRSSGRP